MGFVGHWLQEHHWPKEATREHWLEVVNLAKVGWVNLLLIVLGIFALMTAIIIAYPALAFLAARFFS